MDCEDVKKINVFIILFIHLHRFVIKKNMLEGLKHAHSGFRWILLLFLVGVIVNSILKWKRNESFKIKDGALSTITLIITHSMVLLGLVLYFMGKKFDIENSNVFYAIVHPLGMILAATFITIGHSKAKKSKTSRSKFRKIFVWFLAGLIIIMISIPWPFIYASASWA